MCSQCKRIKELRGFVQEIEKEMSELSGHEHSAHALNVRCEEGDGFGFFLPESNPQEDQGCYVREAPRRVWLYHRRCP